jgi:hypothetical protein
MATALLVRGTGHRLRPVLGTVDDLRWRVPVTDDLSSLAERPDIIHGQHHLETMTALLHFAGVPAIFYCHGWLPPQEAPPRFPRILRYVAVDDVCRDRLVCEHGLSPDQVEVRLNFVVTARFGPRGPLPPRPAAAALFCNEVGPHVAVVREACAAPVCRWILGRAWHRRVPNESVLRRYDLVFARHDPQSRPWPSAPRRPGGAVGSRTDGDGSGLRRLRRLNFGIRALRLPLERSALVEEIGRYDAADAAEVSRRVRATAGRDEAVEGLLTLYGDVLDQWRKAPSHADAAEESRSASRYLRSLKAPLNGWRLGAIR